VEVEEKVAMVVEMFGAHGIPGSVGRFDSMLPGRID